MTQLQMHTDYNPNELCRAQIEAICEYYSNTFAAIAANPSGRYEEFSPLSAPERRQLLVDWNSTHRDYPKDKRVHELFEAQAGRTPDSVAAVLPHRRASRQRRTHQIQTAPSLNSRRRKWRWNIAVAPL